MASFRHVLPVKKQVDRMNVQALMINLQKAKKGGQSQWEHWQSDADADKP